MHVSIIIPLFHGKNYIPMLLENIRENYEYVNRFFVCEIEVIFVNDCHDKFGDIEQGIWPMSVSVLENGENMGIHYSRVRGLKAAKGQYILFLDQDDHIDKSFIHSQMVKIEGYDVIICNGMYRNNRLIMQDKKARDRIEDPEYFFSSMNIIVSPGQALIRKSVIPEEWRRNILNGNDCDDAFLWLLMKNAGRRFKVNEAVLYYHNEGHGNTSFLWGHNISAWEEMYDVIVQKRLIQGERFFRIKQRIESQIGKYTQYEHLEALFSEVQKIQIKEYMEKKGYNTIAIYGYGVLGKKFMDFLQDTQIKIAYAIDENAKAFIDSNVALFSLEDELGTVDAVIVSALFIFDEIKEKIEMKMNCDVVALDKLLDESRSIRI